MSSARFSGVFSSSVILTAPPMFFKYQMYLVLYGREKEREKKKNGNGLAE